ncbi:MAG: 4'-phosphopantetheinyl transferase superfamily protein [Alistipes sp.]|nr:4'-phosphopantetheinyl transferase superfamily protein [Alistipes sp.]
MIIISIKDIPKAEQHRHAWGLLCQCLKRRGIAFSEADVLKGAHGKPYLPAHPELSFNISHAEGIAACIVSDRECGIDCEPVRQYRPNVMRRAFSEGEIALIENSDEEERDLLFFRLWTLKEAYIKAIGTGLSFPMKEAEFSFCGGRIITDIQGFSFRQYTAGNNSFVISVCESMNKL